MKSLSFSIFIKLLIVCGLGAAFYFVPYILFFNIESVSEYEKYTSTRGLALPVILITLALTATVEAYVQRNYLKHTDQYIKKVQMYSWIVAAIALVIYITLTSIFGTDWLVEREMDKRRAERAAQEVRLDESLR